MAVQQVLVRDPTTNLPKELIPNQTSAGSADAGKIPALNSAGQIDATMLGAAGAPSLSIASSENLAASALVNIDSTGKVRNANATDATKPAMGFVLAAVTSPANATVLFSGQTVPGVSGLTVGAPVYLSAATAGGVVSAAPTAAGNLVQQVGIAISATEFNFQPMLGIIHG
jgi:hypothetical protein